MENEPVSMFTEVRNWIEVIYFISQIIVMVLVGFGLRQIQLAKRQIETTKDIFRTQSKRSAIETAVVECRRFAETIIQDKLALDKFCKEKSITYFEKAKFTKTENGFSVDPKDIDKDDLKKLQEAADLINRIMNGLEAYALFFLSGVADENIAFHTNAKAYIEITEDIFKIFPVIKIEDEDAEPMKTLYFMWSQRYEAKRLSIEQEEIKKKLSSYKISSVKAIGT